MHTNVHHTLYYRCIKLLAETCWRTEHVFNTIFSFPQGSVHIKGCTSCSLHFVRRYRSTNTRTQQEFFMQNIFQVRDWFMFLQKPTKCRHLKRLDLRTRSEEFCIFDGISANKNFWWLNRQKIFSRYLKNYKVERN